MLVDRQINLMDVLKLYLKRWWVILIAMIIGGAIAFGYTTTFVTPMYTSYGTLYTENTSDILNQDVSGVDYNTVMVRKELVGTYAEVLTSNSFMQIVADKSDLGYTPAEIRSMIAMQSKNETEILVIAVKTLDPRHSHIIAQKILDMAPGFVSEIVEGGSVKILDQPVFSETPSSPNVVRNTEIGAILGILFSLALVLAIEIIDNKVKDADAVAKMFKYPILGEIPTMQNHQRREKKEKNSQKTVKA